MLTHLGTVFGICKLVFMHLSSLPAGDYRILDQKAYDPKMSGPTLKNRTVTKTYSSTKRYSWAK